MLTALKGLFKKRKHDWIGMGGCLSSTAWSEYYWTTFVCKNCWWVRTFIIQPHIHNELKDKTPQEFFEAIEAHVLAGVNIPFYRYYCKSNPWEPYYKDTRKNPLWSSNQYREYGMGKEIVLIPGQLTEFGAQERCRPWAKEQPMQPLH